MDKSAKTEHPISKVLSERWSPRAFNDDIPTEKQLKTLLEAARWAASSYNEQPWRFVVGIKGEGSSYQNIFECLNEFNQAWAKGAPVLLMVCAKEEFSHNGNTNKHFMYDCGAAMSNLCTQATAEGLHVHQMAGIHPDKAKDVLNVPDGFKAITAAAIGFAGDPNQLPDDHKKSELAERKRKPLSEISFLGSWDESYS